MSGFAFRSEKTAKDVAAIARQRPPSQWSRANPIVESQTVLVKVPQSGLPALSGSTPGSVNCVLQYIDQAGALQNVQRTPIAANGTLEAPVDHEVLVYNVTEAVIPEGYVTALRYGRALIATAGGGGASFTCEDLCECLDALTSVGDSLACPPCSPDDDFCAFVTIKDFEDCPENFWDDSLFWDTCSGCQWTDLHKTVWYRQYKDDDQITRHQVKLEGNDWVDGSALNLDYRFLRAEVPEEFRYIQVGFGVSDQSWAINLDTVTQPDIGPWRASSTLFDDPQGTKEWGYFCDLAADSCVEKTGPQTANVEWGVYGHPWGELPGGPSFAEVFRARYPQAFAARGCKTKDATAILARGKDYALRRTRALAQLLKVPESEIEQWLKKS